MFLAAALALAAVPDTLADRTDEIWGHADVRVSRQIEQWFKDGDFPRSVGLLRFQAAYSPKDYDVATNLGWLLESMERDDDALAAYTEYRLNNPEDADNRLPEAMLYNSRRKWDKVVEVLEPTLGKNPHPNVYRLLAKSYERIGKPDDAIRVWTLQLKRWPDDGPAKANIARVKAKIEKAKTEGTPANVANGGSAG